MLRLELLVIAVEHKAKAEQMERLLLRGLPLEDRKCQELSLALTFQRKWEESYTFIEGQVSLREMWKDVWRDANRRFLVVA
jgi:hypothetical protein